MEQVGAILIIAKDCHSRNLMPFHHLTKWQKLLSIYSVNPHTINQDEEENTPCVCPVTSGTAEGTIHPSGTGISPYRAT